MARPHVQARSRIAGEMLHLVDHLIAPAAFRPRAGTNPHMSHANLFLFQSLSNAVETTSVNYDRTHTKGQLCQMGTLSD